MYKFLFYNKFIYVSTCFEAYLLIIRRSKLYYTAWYRHTYRWPSGAQVERGLCTGRPPTGVMISDAI